MKLFSLLALSGIIATITDIRPAIAADFLIDQMASFYCGAMEDKNPKMMSSYDRGLIEGMSLGFVMGTYPERLAEITSMSEGDFNSKFYPKINQKCPQYSFGIDR